MPLPDDKLIIEKFFHSKVFSEMHRDFIESGGFDLDKLFIEPDSLVKRNTTLSLVSTKKKGSQIKHGSDKNLEELQKIGEEFRDAYDNARDLDDFSDEEFKELSDLYDAVEFDKSGIQTNYLLFCEEHYNYFEHEFQYDTPLEEDCFNEFQRPEDDILLKKYIDFISMDLDYNFEHNFKHISLENDNDTGYIIPSFNFVGHSVSSFELIQKYDAIVTDFKSSHIKNGSLADLISITQFRDIMYSQVKRQMEVIDNLNDKVKIFLTFFYRALELDTLQIHKNKNPRLYEKGFECDGSFDWYYYVGMVRAINRMFSSNKLDKNELKSHVDKINKIPIINDDFKETICDLLNGIYQKKEPILNIANNLLIKIRCTESIIEDVLTEQTLKQPEDFVDWFSSQSEVTMPKQGIAREDIIRVALEKKQKGESVISIFNDMREWLLNEEEGFGEKEFKEKYGFGISDPDSFNRFLNKI